MAHTVATKIFTIIFDFDNTLYDTEKRKVFFRQIAGLHGYSQVDAYRIYNEARQDGEVIAISLEKYLAVLKSNLKRDQKEFREAGVNEILIAMEKGDNLLPGARRLVESCFKERLSCYLLSLGVREWQEMKLMQSGLAGYFEPDRIIFTENVRQGKKDAIRQLFGDSFSGEGAILVNDKPDETRELLVLFSKLRAFVRCEKRDNRYQKKDFDNLLNDFSGRVVWAETLPTIKTLLAL